MKEMLRARKRAERLYETIADLVRGPVSLMEVCGTHTMAIGRFGMRARLPAALRLISGPGCPVCVTPCVQVDQAIAMAREPGVTVVTFGDMVRVPGSDSSLDRERAAGCDVRIVYSPLDALDIALAEPRRTFVFVGIGFETTSPTVAATLVRAERQGVENLLVLCAFKLVAPAMIALVADDRPGIGGFLCPGHVTAVTGCEPYVPIVKRYRIPCVVAGFEAVDILEGVAMLLSQIAEGRADVEVGYKRAVPWEGNRMALGLLDRVFRRSDARWRGIGTIPGSGLELAPEYGAFDALARVPVEVSEGRDFPDGCRCGEVLRGRIVPAECGLFGGACVPARPVGPCMVSSEGACAAWYRHRGHEG